LWRRLHAYFGEKNNEQSKGSFDCGKLHADLVVELPSPFAVATAEKFAFGGAALLNSLGCCDRIYFGSESDSPSRLEELAMYLHSPEFNSEIADRMKLGGNFASLREEIVRVHMGDIYGDIIGNPNDILGIEYIKALNVLNSKIEPHTIKRFGAAHDSDQIGITASAKAIREAIECHHDYSGSMPRDSYNLLEIAIKEAEAPASMKYCERSILADLRRAKPEDLKDIPDVAEGIENKIISAASVSKNLEALYYNVKSKRYSHARIRRIILSYYLRNYRSYDRIPYIRVLGMNKNGLEIIKSKKNRLPFVMNYSDVKKLDDYSKALFEHEALVDDIYALMKPDIGDGGKYYTTPIIAQL